MAQVRMQMNLPVTIQDAKYLDCMPPGQFGSQLRLKGTINGEPNSVMYLPGKVWSARKALIEAGVIGEDDFDEEPAEAINIPLLKTAFVLTNKQVAGKNYGNISVSFLVASQSLLPSNKGQNTGPLLPSEEEGYIDALTGNYGNGAITTVLPSDPMESVGKLYLECMKYAVDKIIPLWEAGEVKYDASALNAATATLMIQRGKR